MFVPPDADARRAIAEDTESNIVVEAAAGTGKTTCLVARLMTLLRRGVLSGSARFAAVTFTTKAASELRERLEHRLAEALADESEPAESKRNLAAAAVALPECHIGTIHSFCSRLIRERPVEAGVNPDFSEMDNEADALARRQAWDEFTADLAHGTYPDITAAFADFDLDLESLYPGFVRFADFPDIQRWPGRDFQPGAIDTAGFVDSINRFLGRCYYRDRLAAAEPGNDALIPLLRRLDRRMRRIRVPTPLTDAHRLLRILKENPKQVQSMWPQLGVDKKNAKDELIAYGEFLAAEVEPFRNDCLALTYAVALRCFHLAKEKYDSIRRHARALNFQDLLLRAAALLRDYPDARADLADRYARLLVDEVQDTDPVQAEIMFLLASAKPNEKQWRHCPPRPGALFIVGDPKQSIYRFRRADIVVYQEMKRLIVQNGGVAVVLVTNFRSRPEVVQWVNRMFAAADHDAGKTDAEMALSGRFPRSESPYSPAYIPLQPGQSDAATGFAGVYRLDTIPYRKGVIENADIIHDEAGRIAAFIRNAVDTGMRLPERSGGSRPARPGDFLIVTYGKKTSAAYAAAVRSLGLPCHVSGGASLKDSLPLAWLRNYLDALANPDDPVLLIAVLRGGLFGFSDQELYRWKKAGGAFSFTARPPADGDPRMAAALQSMRSHARLFVQTHPIAALERIAEDLGLWALASLGDDPNTGAGMVATAFELLRSDGDRLVGISQVAARLGRHIDQYESDPYPVRPETGEAVRIMNLHQTKGLEAPVVFLTCTREMKTKHATQIAVARTIFGSEAALAVFGGERNSLKLAQPGDWEKRAGEEELFLAAEKTRLRYVAATRAGAALIVSVYRTSEGEWKSAFLAEPFDPDLILPNPLPEPEPGSVRPNLDGIATEPDAAVPDQFAAQREENLRALLTPSYGTARAKDGADSSPEPVDTVAVRFGEALHALLEQPAADDRLLENARHWLREYELDIEPEVAVDMIRQVRSSPLWRRAAAAESAFRETPFTLRGDGNTLVRGVIDLVFKEDGGWVLVDYKSDAIPASVSAASAAEKHREQLHAYRAAWSSLTGEPVKETGIYFLRRSEYIVLE